MNNLLKSFIISIIFSFVLVNSVYGIGQWGVDENGKFSYDTVIIIIRDEYSQCSEDVIKHLEKDFGFENIKILSENTMDSTGAALTVRVDMQVVEEEQFYSKIELLKKDQYVESVLKDYYMVPSKSYLGDMNQDGQIKTDDACLILKCAAGQINPQTATEKFLADMDGDGVITTLDVRQALKISGGIVD